MDLKLQCPPLAMRSVLPDIIFEKRGRTREESRNLRYQAILAKEQCTHKEAVWLQSGLS